MNRLATHRKGGLLECLWQGGMGMADPCDIFRRRPKGHRSCSLGNEITG